MSLLQTERLQLRELNHEDAAFMLELLNEPDFIRFIADRGVRTIEDAKRYLDVGPIDSYQRYGFGLQAVELREGGETIGICGLIKRPNLADVDLGFAFLQRHGGKGYASEAAAATLQHGREALGLKRIVAITNLDNLVSIRVLEKIGMHFEGIVKILINVEEGEIELRLFST